MPIASKPLVSIIIPVLNEEETVRVAYDTVVAVMEPISDRYQFEILFSDNRSEDKTPEILEQIAKEDPRVRVTIFSRNFGFQRSIHYGYTNARGDVAVQLDCDMQDPPHMILDFLEKWEEGYEVVFGVRKSRKEGVVINALRTIFYTVIDKLSEDRLPRHAGDFRLVSRRVIEALRNIDDYHPYLRGQIATIGFKQIGLPYDRNERKAGESKFGYSHLVGLALDGILFHSVVPLRLATVTGLIMAVITFLAIIGYSFGHSFFGQDWPRGFTTTTVLILFGITLNALFLGVIGEYLGRIYQQVKRRPLTITDKRFNWYDED